MSKENKKPNTKFIITFLEEKKEIPITDKFEEFKTKICQLFELSAESLKGLEMNYKDNEGDLIYLSDEEDYSQLLLSIEEMKEIEVFITFKSKSVLSSYSQIPQNESKVEDKKNIQQEPLNPPINPKINQPVVSPYIIPGNLPFNQPKPQNNLQFNPMYNQPFNQPYVPYKVHPIEPPKFQPVNEQINKSFKHPFIEDDIRLQQERVDNRQENNFGFFGGFLKNLYQKLPTFNLFGAPIKNDKTKIIAQARNTYDLRNISDERISAALDKCNGNIEEAVISLTLEN